MAREAASHVMLSGPKGDAPASTGTADHRRSLTSALNQGRRAEPRDESNGDEDASPVATSSGGLKGLLARFKAARIRRDDSAINSPEWFAADDDIRLLQHDIFVGRQDDQIAENDPSADSEDDWAADPRDRGTPTI